MPKPYVIIPPSEIERFKAFTRGVSEQNRQECDQLIKHTAMTTQRRAMMFAPVGKKKGIGSGFLRRSVGYKIDGAMSALIWAGGAGSGINVKYAPYVEFGTGTRVSVPGDVKEYAIQYKGAGLRKVNNRAQPYFFPALRLSTKEMFAKLKQMGFN
jgi:hypothetical protein